MNRALNIFGDNSWNRDVNRDVTWENAKSNRSHCANCRNYIEIYHKRLKVPTKFGRREGYLFYCETCANVRGFKVVDGLGEKFGSGLPVHPNRFYKYYRKITLYDEEKNGE